MDELTHIDKEVVRNGVRTVLMTVLFPKILMRSVETNIFPDGSQSWCNVITARKTAEFAANTMLDWWFGKEVK